MGGWKQKLCFALFVYLYVDEVLLATISGCNSSAVFPLHPRRYLIWAHDASMMGFCQPADVSRSLGFEELIKDIDPPSSMVVV